MTKSEILRRIREHQDAIVALGATALFIYGSRAREDAQETSDLDVFVDYDPEKFDFVKLVDLERFLSGELGMAVQLGTKDALHPLLREGIIREAVRVF